jgi:hypothetical protein
MLRRRLLVRSFRHEAARAARAHARAPPLPRPPKRFLSPQTPTQPRLWQRATPSVWPAAWTRARRPGDPGRWRTSSGRQALFCFVRALGCTRTASRREIGSGGSPSRRRQACVSNRTLPSAREAGRRRGRGASVFLCVCGGEVRYANKTSGTGALVDGVSRRRHRGESHGSHPFNCPPAPSHSLSLPFNCPPAPAFQPTPRPPPPPPQ